MNRARDPMTQRLLGQLPDPAELPEYRQQVGAMLKQADKKINRERVLTNLFWIFCVVCAVARLWFSAGSAKLPREPFLACIFFIWGGMEVVKHHIKASQIAVLKEVKQLQLQVLELEESLIK
jgi:hypothetical protein